MKKPGIIEGIVVAAVLSIVLIPLKLFWSIFLPWFLVKNAAAGMIAGVYIVYLLSRSPRRVGRFILGVGSIVALIAASLVMSSVEYIFFSVALIWGVRSLISYRSFASAGLDAFLCMISVGLALWAFQSTFSVTWALWSFFLGQALFVLIPRRFGRKISECFAVDKETAYVPERMSRETTFSRAQRAAERALSELIGASA